MKKSCLGLFLISIILSGCGSIRRELPLSDINISNALIQPEDILFAGLFTSADWHECTTTDDISEFEPSNPTSVILSGFIVWHTPQCSSIAGGVQDVANWLYISEEIYITSDARQTARISEELKAYYYQMWGVVWTDTESSFEMDSTEIWIAESTGIFIDYALIVINYDTATIGIKVRGDNIISKEDYSELIDLAIIRIKNARLE